MNGESYQAILFPAVSELLTAHLRRELANGRRLECEYVLSTPTGRPLQQRNIGKALTEAALAAGLGKVAPHDLWRWFCSLAAQCGVSPAQAARMTGHSLDVFTRHYADDYGRAHREEARARLLEA